MAGSDVHGTHLFNDVDDVTDLESQFIFKLRLVILRHFDDSQRFIYKSYKGRKKGRNLKRNLIEMKRN